MSLNKITKSKLLELPETDYTKYEANSTEKELEKLLESVFVDDDIIILNQVHEPTFYSYTQQFNKIRDLIQNIDSFYLIINVQNSVRPSAENKAFIMEQLKTLKDKMRYCCVVTGKNFFVNILAHFVLKGAGFKNFSTVRNFSDALRLIKKIE